MACRATKPMRLWLGSAVQVPVSPAGVVLVEAVVVMWSS
jgi:hypothetical protein